VRRSLSREEAALWARVAGTVAPLTGRKAELPPEEAVALKAPTKSALNRLRVAPAPPPKGQDLKRPPLDRSTLDASWDRKLARGLVAPDFTLDLHGHSLDQAHARLEHGIAQALAQQARLLLLITGRPRPSSDQAGRSERRGAIRAKFLDWLTLGSHATKIAAIRPAHPRHGGAGAVYILLRRPR
jgi:DNA-nicking Smr family endonuclease